MQKTNTFFSYPRKHADVVRDFYTFSTIFEGQHFLDERSIPLGADFPETIEKAIDSCDIFVLLWCACASESNWVNNELSRALEKKKRVVPILLSDFPLPQSIERVNGVKLHTSVCVQRGMGVSFGAYLFRDNYQLLSSVVKESLLREIERVLL